LVLIDVIFFGLSFLYYCIWRLFIKKITGIKTRKYIYICCHWHPQNALKPMTIVCDEKDALEFAFEMEVEFGSQKNLMLKYMQLRSFSFRSFKPTKMHGIHLIIIHQVIGHFLLSIMMQ
jgi:hypothetical protein